jgi:hypothetical protein
MCGHELGWKQNEKSDKSTPGGQVVGGGNECSGFAYRKSLRKRDFNLTLNQREKAFVIRRKTYIGSNPTETQRVEKKRYHLLFDSCNQTISKLCNHSFSHIQLCSANTKYPVTNLTQ